MQYRKTMSKTASSCFWAIITAVVGFAGNAQAQNTPPDFVQLRDGVVINKNRNEVYIATPQNRVQALGMATGQALWTSDMEATPLAIANTKLVCLAKTAASDNAGGNEIGIVELDIARRGSRLGSYKELLPGNVNLNNRPNINTVFTISPRWVQNNVYLSWQYRAFPMRGKYDNKTKQQDLLPVADSGAFRLEKVGGKLTNMLKSALPPNLNQQAPLIINQVLENDKFGQFLSADRLHALTSTKFADDSVFEHFRWEVFEVASGRKLGELTDYRSYAPFYVTGNTIVYEKGPYMVANNGDILSVPLQLVAVNISNGQTLWKKDIFDNVYRGTLPPAKTN